MNKTVVGVLSTTDKGTGFVSVEGADDRDKDILIEPGKTDLALNGDTVKIELLDDDTINRQSGRVIEVITKTKRSFVGTVQKKPTVTFVKPDDYKIHKDFFLPQNQSSKVSDGDKVQVKIVKWDNPDQAPLAEVVKVLGKKGEHEAEMQSILIEQNIIDEFPIEVKREAEQLSENRDQIFAKALADPHRRDCRHLNTATIDPVDAKDFDDALSVEWHDAETAHVTIGVHIADVSHFVTAKSALDREAFERSFSTYLVDRTIPMLPSELSTDLCSLNPNTDRLAFSGFFEFKENHLKKVEFSKTIIHSNHRFAYEDAQAIIEAGQPDLVKPEHQDAAQDIQFLNDLALILKDRRLKNGAIEFSDDEVKFELDENKKPIGVYPYERKEAHKMVEEFMLLCNQEAAKWFGQKSKELGATALSVFRVHDNPDRDKLIELNNFIQTLGYDGLKKEDLAQPNIRHQVIQKLLAMVENSPIEDLVNNQMLRAMAKAAYAVIDKGHFGLAFDHYLHFTSPIRRYPDLLVHRAMNHYLRGELPPNSDTGYYANAAKQASEREITTVSAERASIAYKQVEYMEDKVGQEFDALISGISQYGLFVEEQTSKAQGLIRANTMGDDFYEFKPAEYAFVGKNSGKKYHIGDAVKIKLTGANLDRRQLDFELVK